MGEASLVRASDHGSAPGLPDVPASEAGENEADREVFALPVVRLGNFDGHWLYSAPAFRTGCSTQIQGVSPFLEDSFPGFDGIANDVANLGILVLPIPERHSRDAVFYAAGLDIRLAALVGIGDIASNADAFVDRSVVRIHSSMITKNRRRVKSVRKKA